MNPQMKKKEEGCLLREQHQQQQQYSKEIAGRDSFPSRRRHSLKIYLLREKR